MIDRSTILSLATISALALILAGCGGKEEAGKSRLGVPSSSLKQALLGKKPSGASRVGAAPGALPRLGQDSSIETPDPFANEDESSFGDEAWSFEPGDEVDVDGDGDAEAGNVLYDDEADVLYLWWEDEGDLLGDGDVVSYRAVAWFSDLEIGVVIETEEMALACVESEDASYCVVCGSDGSCELLDDGFDESGEASRDYDQDLAEDDVLAEDGGW